MRDIGKPARSLGVNIKDLWYKMLASLPPRFLRLLRDQWLPPDRLRRIQQRKLRRLLTHAYEKVPYYRELMRSVGAEPGDFEDADALTGLPITRKAKLLEQPLERRLVRDVDRSRLVAHRTSGSSGMPMEIFLRREDKAWWPLLALRAWLANGYRVNHRMAVLSDSRFVPGGRHWYEYLGLFRQHHVSIYECVHAQLEAIGDMRPDVVRGMTSDVYRLARAVRERDVDVPTPRRVFTSAELMDDATRRYIDETFGVRLVDFYGSMECGWIAWECPRHAGYHVNADCLIVELIRDGLRVAPGEPGEVVVTNLHNYAMPFIRYSVGDVGVASGRSCPCGRGLPLMSSVEGRIADCVLLADGRMVSPYQLTCTVETIPGIQRYQIVQTDLDRLTVRVIPDASYSEDTPRRIQRDLERLLGEGVRIRPTLVRELAVEPGGKFHVVKSQTATR